VKGLFHTHTISPNHIEDNGYDECYLTVVFIVKPRDGDQVIFMEKPMTRAIEQALSLVPVTKPKTINPVVQRRTRLLKSIRRQQSLVEAYKSGEKTFRTWFWMNEDGKIYLQIKYGKVALELGKGKYAIQCNSLDDVASNLTIVETLVNKGEFDAMLSTISKEIRSKFTKS
jgi:hypothetical protein